MPTRTGLSPKRDWLTQRIRWVIPLPFLISTKVFPTSDFRNRCRRFLRKKCFIFGLP